MIIKGHHKHRHHLPQDHAETGRVCYLVAGRKGRTLACLSVHTDTQPASPLALRGPPAWNTHGTANGKLKWKVNYATATAAGFPPSVKDVLPGTSHLWGSPKPPLSKPEVGKLRCGGHVRPDNLVNPARRAFWTRVTSVISPS